MSMPGMQVLLVNDAYKYYQSLSQLAHDSYKPDSFWFYYVDFSFSIYGKLFDKLAFLTSW